MLLLTICLGGGWQVPGWAAATSQLRGGVQGRGGSSDLAHAAWIWSFVLFHRYIHRWSHCAPCSVSEERLTSKSPVMWGSYRKKRVGEAALWFLRCPVRSLSLYPAADSLLDFLMSARCMAPDVVNNIDERLVSVVAGMGSRWCIWV